VFWLWDRLHEVAPPPLAAVCMPNHLHVLVRVDDPDGLRDDLARTLGHWRRRFGPEGFAWQPVPPPELVTGNTKILRSIRYVVLNPNRAGLCDDPLEWVMSTHRDAMGAVADPWLDAAGLRELGVDCSDEEARERLHTWVSGDPTVRAEGTPPPTREEATTLARHPLTQVARAAASAMRGLPGDVRLRGATRSLFVALAARHGWGETTALAEACAASPRTIRRLREAPSPEAAIRAAELCLGDPRCRAAGGLVLDDEWELSRPEGRRRGPPGAAPPEDGPLTLVGRLRRWVSPRGHSR